jgi:hypothetical protein
MKATVKTIKGYINNSDLMFSENSNNNLFLNNLEKYIIENDLLSKGFKKLSSFQTLRDKQAKEKIIIKGYYWRGSWSDPSKETYCTYYR